MRIILFVLCLLACILSRTDAEMVVIVNKSNPAGSLARKDVADIYLGKKRLFENGVNISPADLPEGNSARAEFFRDVIRKDEDAYRSYWIRMIFSGKGHPPVSLPSEADVVNHVRKSNGAIGFVERGNATPDVRIIAVEGMGKD